MVRRLTVTVNWPELAEWATSPPYVPVTMALPDVEPVKPSLQLELVALTGDRAQLSMIKVPVAVLPDPRPKMTLPVGATKVPIVETSFTRTVQAED